MKPISIFVGMALSLNVFLLYTTRRKMHIILNLIKISSAGQRLFRDILYHGFITPTT